VELSRAYLASNWDDAVISKTLRNTGECTLRTTLRRNRGVGEPCHDKQWYEFDAAATNKLGQPVIQTDFLEEYLTFI